MISFQQGTEVPRMGQHDGATLPGLFERQLYINFLFLKNIQYIFINFHEIIGLNNPDKAASL